MYLRLILAGILLTGLACGDKAEDEGSSSGSPEAVPVELVEVKKISALRYIELSGDIEPWRQVDLGGEMSAKLERLYVDEGDDVTKGQLLARMADENLAKAESHLQVVKKDYERMKRLLDKGTVTRQAFDRARAEYDAARASYETILSSTRITATINGTVTEKLLEEGEVYLMMPGEAGSPAILQLMELDRLKVTAGVPETDLARIAAGDSALLTVDTWPDRRFHGTVHRIHPTVDRETRTAKIEIMVPNENRLLKPGMYARIRLATGMAEGLFVPNDAVLRQPGTGTRYLFEVDHGKAVRHDVRTGIMHDEMLEVTSGIEGDESIVVSGQSRLSTGLPVKVVQEGGTR